MALGKAELRAAALQRRQNVSRADATSFAQRLADAGLAFAQQNQAKTVSLYRAIGAEANPALLLDALALHGFTTCLPITGKRGVPLVFRQWRPGDAHTIGRMNIEEPASELPICEPDLLFMPLAAFDRDRHRIGYGAGYYDVTLRHLRARGKVIAVGLAFACQEVARVPFEAHDERLDFILTETEWIG